MLQNTVSVPVVFIFEYELISQGDMVQYLPTCN
jgi:hypothetical protein